MTEAAAPAAAPPARPVAFRADINGLRAIAVLAVLAFHFRIAPFAGGFVGVDVFFVISGYLMTGIILSRMDRGTFSVLGFYLDRARRIVPALLVLVAAVLALGWFILLPDEYLILSKHAATSATFLSNILYWRESGYFEPGVDQKWLLHTWSLSVEWQFYLLYPLLVLAVARLAPRRLWAPLIAAAAALSFALMVSFSGLRPEAGFFLLPPRAWEMLAGGLVYLSPRLPGRATRPAQALGLALILAAAILAPAIGWPNAWALAPALGTALVILARRTDSRITGNPVAAWIGINSYSIYLWHWPVVVLLARLGLNHGVAWVALGIAASLLLGHLSWRFIERLAQPGTARPRIHTAPIRFGWREHARFAVPVALLVVVCAGVWKARGIPQRFSAEVRLAAQDSLRSPVPGSQPCFSDFGAVPEPCVLGPAPAPVLATLIGDSFSEAELRGLVEAIPAGKRGGIAFSAYAGCPPMLGATAVDSPSQCAAFNARYLEPQTRPRTIPLIVIANWTGHFELRRFRFPGSGATPSAAEFRANLLRSSCALAAGGPTYVVLPTPAFPFSVSRELQHRLIRDPNSPDIGLPLAQHLARNRDVIAVLREAERRCGVRLLDPAPYICPGGVCQGSRGGRALYIDGYHMSAYGARLLVPMFRTVFAGAAAAPPAGAAG